MLKSGRDQSSKRVVFDVRNHMLKVILLRITCDARNATSTNKKNKRNEATNICARIKT